MSRCFCAREVSSTWESCLGRQLLLEATREGLETLVPAEAKEICARLGVVAPQLPEGSSHVAPSRAHCRRLWLGDGLDTAFPLGYPHLPFAGPSEGPRPPSVSVWTTDEALGQCLILAHREDSVRFATGLHGRGPQSAILTALSAVPQGPVCNEPDAGCDPPPCIVVAWPVGLHVTSCEWTHDGQVKLSPTVNPQHGQSRLPHRATGRGIINCLPEGFAAAH